MNENYKDKYILKKITDTNFTFTDLNPMLFPSLVHGDGMYCPFHVNSHTGTKQARVYFDEEWNMYYIHCYAEGKNFTAFDYLYLIMCKQKGLYSHPLDFLLLHMDKNEFIRQYTLFKKQKQVISESQFKKKCEYIDNVFNQTGDIAQYIETLYCG